MYFSMIILMILIMPLLIMPREIKSGIRSPYSIIVRTTVSITAMIALIFMGAAMSGSDVYSEMYKIMELGAQEAASNEQAAEVFGMEADSVDTRVKALMTVYSSALKQMPACLMLIAAVVSYLEYMMLAKIQGRKRNVKKLPPFREFSFPSNAGMAVTFMLLAGILMFEVEAEIGEMMYLNMNLIFDMVFSIQGISVILMFFHMKRSPKILGIGIAAVLWITYIGRLLLMILGILDLTVNLKKRIQGGVSR